MITTLDAIPAEAGRWEVTVARYGRRDTVRSDVFLNHQLYGEADRSIGMDYFVWVVRNEWSTIVVDTGFSREAGDARGREMLIDPRKLFDRLEVDPATAPIPIDNPGIFSIPLSFLVLVVVSLLTQKKEAPAA